MKKSVLIPIPEKVCSLCKTLKFASDYHRQTTSSTGLQSKCKLCHKSQREKRKHIEKIEAAERYQKNKAHHRAVANEYYKKYYAENREKIVAKSVEYNRKRYYSNPTHRLCHHFSNRIRATIQNKERNRAFSLLPYSKEDLISHLEAQFKDGMSWENYGDWHIDHKKPIAAFSFTQYQDEQFIECWSLENLQPLWALDNIKKGGRYEKTKEG